MRELILRRVFTPVKIWTSPLSSIMESRNGCLHLNYHRDPIIQGFLIEVTGVSEGVKDCFRRRKTRKLRSRQQVLIKCLKRIWEVSKDFSQWETQELTHSTTEIKTEIQSIFHHFVRMISILVLFRAEKLWTTVVRKRNRRRWEWEDFSIE